MKTQSIRFWKVLPSEIGNQVDSKKVSYYEDFPKFAQNWKIRSPRQLETKSEGKLAQL